MDISDIIKHNNYFYIGTNESVKKREFSEVIGINNISSEIPAKYSLKQNYPNPFNPKTRIKFDIRNSGLVRLKVFNALGKEVAEIVNENLSSGSYEADFDGANLSSGIYFYKIETEGFAEVKKMTLLK